MDRDTSRCPLCSGSNLCAMSAGALAAGNSADAEDCWCQRETVPAELLARVPEADRGKACICQACVKAYRSGLSRAEFYNADL